MTGLFDGDDDRVKAASSEGAALTRAAGDLYGLGMMLMNLGMSYLLAGELPESKRCFAEALQFAYRIDDRVAQLYLLSFMAWHAASSGHAQLGAQLLGAAEAVLGVGANVMPFLAPPLPQVREIGVAALGASCIDAEFGTGQRLAQDELVALALGTVWLRSLRPFPLKRRGPSRIDSSTWRD